MVGSKNDISVISSDFISVALSETNTSNNEYCTQSYLSRFWFSFSSGATFTNYKFRLQLEINDTGNTAYVQYRNYNPNGAQTYTVPIKDT